MKALTTLILAAMSAAAFAADSPEQIATDYREKAAAALDKVNATLEKATVPLIAALVKQGDTAGADTLKAQLKDKIAGEPVLAPQASAAALFKSYDAARSKALEPAQKAAISRIDAMLASSEGKKLETVDALSKVRAEVEGGKSITSSSYPSEWTYHVSPDSKATALMRLLPDGVMQWKDGGVSGATKSGTWKQRKDGLVINFENEEWKMTVADGVGTVQRPRVGTRYFKAKQ